MLRLRSFLLAFLLPPILATAHDGLDVGLPASDGEAWNVIELCAANVEKLIPDQQWKEVPIQIALIGQSARFLRDRSTGELAERWSALEQQGVILIRAALQNDAAGTQREYHQYRTQLAELEKSVDPKLVRTGIFSCPMCKGVRELDPKVSCFKCGMALVPRVIPASSIYNTPGEPSVVLTPALKQPLSVGQPSTVTIHFARKKDNVAVKPEDLLIVHTERIHLLIVDESLTDYHHEHPRPDDPPGDYTFTFTPRKPGKYRVFADIVPRESNVQEYAICDLPAATPTGDPIQKTGSATASAADTLAFSLIWNTGGLPLRAKQPVNAIITITSADGKPFTQLEPVMGAYSHLVAFHEDHQTVLHIHPTGAEPQKPEDRGGPKFSVRFWAPKPGFYRLYIQVQINGKQIFAPFALNVEP